MKKFTCLILCVLFSTWFSMAENSACISKVWRYVPAPGQFQNQALPAYVSGDTESSILAKISENLVGKTGTIIGLGAYGGYVIVSLDHPVVNKHAHRIIFIKDGLIYSDRPNSLFDNQATEMTE